MRAYLSGDVVKYVGNSRQWTDRKATIIRGINVKNDLVDYKMLHIVWSDSGESWAAPIQSLERTGNTKTIPASGSLRVAVLKEYGKCEVTFFDLVEP